MFFPIGDTQVVGGHKPFVSYAFIGLNMLIFLIQMITPGNLICEFSVIPHDILTGQSYFTLISSMFMHGGVMHILGNILFLWVFADNIEATIGSLPFLVFYLLGGLVATFAHIYFGGGISDELACCIPCQSGGQPCEEGLKICTSYIPSLGASGAISAVMGAYMIMFPSSKVKVLVLIIFRSFFISAWLFLGLWFGQQLISGFGSLSQMAGMAESGVAWWAHIGGFVFGILSGVVFKSKVKNITTEENRDFV